MDGKGNGRNGNSSSSSAAGASETRYSSPRTMQYSEVERLEHERALIRSGEHETMRSRVAALHAAQQERLIRAEAELSRAQEAARAVYEYQVAEAECLLKQGIQDAHEDLLAELEEQLDEARARARGVDTKRSLRAATRSHRRTRTGETGVTASEEASLNRVVTAESILKERPKPGEINSIESVLDTALPREEALKDLRAVLSDWRSRAERFAVARDENLLPVRYERGALHFCNETYRPGEEVVVVSELTAQAFPAEFLGSTATEACVRLDDGSRCRLPLAHMRLGRLVLRRPSDPEVDYVITTATVEPAGIKRRRASTDADTHAAALTMTHVGAPASVLGGAAGLSALGTPRE